MNKHAMNFNRTKYGLPHYGDETMTLLNSTADYAKARAYDRLASTNLELREIRDALIDALRLAMKQLEDPDEDINVIRENATMAIERARRI